MKKYKLNLRKSLDDGRDWRAENIYAAGLLPETFSVRDKLGPIRDQGSFGTCAAQTAICIKEYQEFAEDGLLETFSPMFVYAHRTPKDISGMYPRDVMEILQKRGSISEKEYPYKGKNRNPQNITEKIYDRARNFTISNYARISTIDALKRALITDGPCLIGMPAFNSEDIFWKAGIDSNTAGGHAVAVVGYNKKGFILRNSWGTSWGDKGYGLFPYEDWGIQWEVWTAVDKKSNKIADYKYKAKETGDPVHSWLFNIFFKIYKRIKP